MKAKKAKALADTLAETIASELDKYSSGLTTAREFVEFVAAAATAIRAEMPAPSAGEVDINTGLRYQ